MTDKIEDASFITRKRWGKGFQYFDSNNRKIHCRRQLKRIKALVIPPMWDDVLIATESSAKIQASGRDAKGRKQYIYSEQWQRQQQAAKFGKLPEFAAKLPDMRQYCHKQLQQTQWTPEKVLSLMVLVLDDTGIRIGNKHYAQHNKTYGLSTLRRKHIVEHDDGISLEFTGKSGKQRCVTIDDECLAKHVQQASEQPGYALFRYRENASAWSDVSSDEVNAFIKSQMGEAFTCKDFRTWTASCLAVEYYVEMQQNNKRTDSAKSGNTKPINKIVKKVAKSLGNTPAICREYYIHPKILSAIEDDAISTETLRTNNDEDNNSSYALSAAERTVLRIIE
ncbi:DNA topoisomerase IB [Glaciecola siphonariae]|uniref:DNA topoisomerase n=1 Tax=Glaciecola siphonariae TaxID=521012 RepID=A0ABV9LXW6_9ALTE